jgi:hypothetical protein
LHVALDDRQLVCDVVVVRWERRDIEEDGVDAIGQQPPCDVRAEKTCAAGNQPAGSVSH